MAEAFGTTDVKVDILEHDNPGAAAGAEAVGVDGDI